ncbi:MAG: hypothetical protein M4579_000869 [Chaenotheca gracillima]|nr:MAG: hypothetical protein M4579_000869 [Chaenotheca gracillima]
MAPRAGEFPFDATSHPQSSAFPTTPTSIASSNILHPTDQESPGLLKASSPPNAGLSPNLPNLTSIASAGLRASPSPKSPIKPFEGVPRYSPSPMTGAAAKADEKRIARHRAENEPSRAQSDNPAKTALGALLGTAGGGMSRPHDAPTATTAMSDGMAVAANAIQTHDPMQVDDAQTSPISMSSLGSFHSTSSAIAGRTVAMSPQPIGGTGAGENEGPTSHETPAQQRDLPPHEGGSANRALTFPGPMSANPDGEQTREPPRGMSMPMAGYNQSSPRSPSSSGKKHKCPYCATDFTRHHNLKSHLLTHSHEKPFVCQTCSLRFRRLHDLKRHTKLHTGERPHICSKCGRRFARGDALARHSKGQGGCAGRRSSLGSYDDDEYGDGSHGGHPGDESMDGLVYGGDPDQEHMEGDSDDELRAGSLPSIRTHNPMVPHDPHAPSRKDFQPQHHPSTYPPAAARDNGPRSGGLMPPSSSRGGFSPSSPASQTSTGGSVSSSHNPSMGGPTQQTMGGSNVPSVFAQGGMTESPKPLSPNAASVPSHSHSHPESGSIHRHRSPSLSQQLHQQQFGRKGSGRTPPPMNLPPPPANANAPQLPSLPGLAPPESRYTLPSQSNQQHPQYSSGGATPTSVLSQGGGGSGPHPSGMSTGGSASNANHGHNGQGAGADSNNLFASGQEGIWAYVRSLEERINRLQDEVVSLRGQVNSNSNAGSAPGSHSGSGQHQPQAQQLQQNGVEPQQPPGR